MAVTFPGIGSTAVVPLINRALDVHAAALSPEEFFVLTRVDGRTSLRQIVLICGFPEDRALAILRKLHEVGAIYFPGERPSPGERPGEPPATRAPSVTAGARGTGAGPSKPATPMPLEVGARPSTPVALVARGAGAAPSTLAPASVPGSRAGATPASASVATSPVAASTPDVAAGPAPDPPLDPAALAEDVELTLEQRRAILAKHDVARGGTPYELLEVPRDADRKAIKRAYFRLSKVFHPDRYFGKRLGSYQGRLSAIFEAARRAFEVLDDEERRSQLDAELTGPRVGPALPARATRPVTPIAGISGPPAAARVVGAPPSAAPAAAPTGQPGALARHAPGERESAPAPTRPRPKAAAGAPDGAGAYPSPVTGAAGSSPLPAVRARAVQLFERACEHDLVGDLSTAIAELAACISLDPQPRYLRRAAEVALRAQDLRSAEEYAKRAAGLDPRNASLHRMLAKVLRQAGRLDEARAALERATRLEPDPPVEAGRDAHPRKDPA